MTARVSHCVRVLLAATCTRRGTRGWQFFADIGCEGEGALLPPLTSNKNSGDTRLKSLCYLVAQPSTTRGLLVETSPSLWNTNDCVVNTKTTSEALFGHLSLKWPYSILAPLCYGSRNNATLCMVSSGPLVHHVGALQQSKGGTRYNILTAFSTSFIDSTAENADGRREIHAFVPYHQG